MMKGQRGFWRNSVQQAEKKTQVDVMEVARVAYELYEKRGCEDGRDLEDWLKAEAIVRQRQTEGKN